MRNVARLALAAAIAVAVLPTAPASAYYCGKLLNPVCAAVCRTGNELGLQCVD